MNNKIDGYKAPQPLQSSSAQGAKGATGEQPRAKARSIDSAVTGGADQVTLTQSARSLQKVAAALANTPIVDAKKVDATKLAISSGTYKVDSGQVADKILQFERLLK